MFLNAIKKHLLIIVISFAAVIGTTAALLITRGLVYDKVACPSQIEYGQELKYSAGAFLAGNISYEYRADGSAEWGRTRPIRTGKYYVRAVSARTGGSPSYGKEHAFTILPKKTDVTVGGTVMFGENPGVTADLAYGDTIDCSDYVYTDPTRNATTVSAVLASVAITDRNGEDVTECYSLTAPLCPIVFTPRGITVTVAEKTEEYDGTPISFGGYELTGGTLAQGNMLVCTVDATQTDVGSVNVTPEFRVLDGGGNDVTANYNIKQNVGKITVTQRTLLITAGTDQNVYDGNAFSCTDYEIDKSTSLVAGHTLSPELSSTITDVGTCDNIIAFKVFDGAGTDVTKNYSIVLTVGSLTVTPRPVTVKSAPGKWEYDGEKHSDVSIKDADGIVPGHVAVIVSGDSSIRDVGETPNEIYVTIHDALGNDKTDNYDIDYDYGMLEITPKPVTVTSAGEEFMYNGKPNSKNEILSVGELVEGHYAIADTTDGAFATITDVGDKQNKITALILDADGNDVTKNYDIQYVCGTLIVTPRPITVKAGDDTHVYDDSEFSSNTYEITSEIKLAEGQTGVAECLGAITDVGTADNVIVSFAVFDGEADVTANYAITPDYTPATLTVTKRPTTVTSVDDTYEYDGTPKSTPRISSAENILPWHYAVVVAFFSEITDVGEIENVIEVYIRDVNGPDKTDNYEITYVYGTLTVTPRPITVKSTGRKKVYDGAPLYGKGTDFEIIEGSFALESHIGRAACGGKITDVGTDYNTIFKFYIFDVVNRLLISHNYDVKISDDKGILEVTPRPITVKSKGRDKVYDATPLFGEETDFEITEGDLALPTHYGLATCSGEQTDVGTCDNVITEFRVYIETRDLTGNYDITISNDRGVLEVTPRPITVAAISAKKMYDGTPLACSFAVTSYYQIVQGQTGFATWSHVSTDVCKIETVAISLFEVFDGETDVTRNYEITIDKTPATLEISPRPIKVISKSRQFTYDGDEHYYIDEYDVLPDTERGLLSTDFAVVEGQEVTVATYTKVSDVTRDSEGKAIAVDNDITVAIKQGDVDKTFNYAINYDQKGEILIKPRPIKVVTESQEFDYADIDYDWKYYSVYPDTDKGLLPTDFAIVDGQISYITSYAVAHDVVRDDYGRIIGIENYIYIGVRRVSDSVGKTHNYDFSYDFGTLTVYPIALRYITGSAEKYFDGIPLYGKDAPIEGYSEKGAAIVNKQDIVPWHTAVVEVSDDTFAVFPGAATVNNISTFRVTKTVDGVTVDVTDNYDLAAEKIGTLTVKKVRITVTTESNKKYYDGTPLTEHTASYEVTEGAYYTTGDLPPWFVLSIDVTGSQKDVGESENTATATVAYDVRGAAGIGVYEGCKGDVTEYYDITYDFGALTVLHRPITVTTLSKSFVYDDTSHDYRDGYEISLTVAEVPGTAIASGQRTTVIYYAAITDVGYMLNIINLQVLDADGYDVTHNYDITYVYDGMLTVTPRYITVVTGHSTLEDGVNMWVYDGANHEDSVFKIGASCADAAANAVGLLAHHTLVLDRAFVVSEYNIYPDDDEETGVWKNKLTVAVSDESEADKTRNYVIHYEYGIMKISRRSITVTTPDHHWKYDGKEHADYKVKVGRLGLVEGHIVTNATECTIKDIGSKENRFKVQILDPFNSNVGEVKDVSFNYVIIEYTYGTLTVSQEGPTPIDPDPDDDNDGPVVPNPDLTGDDTGEPKLIMTLETEYKGKLYLRQTSFGDYTGKSFKEAEEYPYGFTYGGQNFGMNYMPTVLLLQKQANGYTVNIKLKNAGYYSLPYFLSPDENGTQTQNSDILYALNGDELGYSVEYYPYIYTSDDGEKLRGTLDVKYQSAEADYYAYVKAHYKDVLPDTKAYMEQLIQENDFARYDESKGADPEVIGRVATFIRESATYNDAYSKTLIGGKSLDDADDMVVAFLRDYKEGVCRHYAAAATMLLRTLGYPARYTVGFSAKGGGKGNEVKVMSTSGHAWTEVYIKGAGWVPVEVTAGGPGGNDDGDADADDDDGDHSLKEPGTPTEPTLVMTIETDYTGAIYLRETSYGDYTGTSFKAAEKYSSGFTYGSKTFGMNYMPTVLLQNRVKGYGMDITLKAAGAYSLPYFLSPDEDGTQIQNSDVKYSRKGSDRSYSVDYYPYMYTSDNGAKLSGTLEAEYASIEADYYAYVQEHYTKVPEATKAYLDELIEAKGFARYKDGKVFEPSLIKKVASFIQGSAKYSTEYNDKLIDGKRLDDADDMVVAFLRDYKEGVCRHYAASATMLYRMLGIPARYTVGYATVGGGKGNPVEVKTPGHAWTEVYIKGAGWVPVEVTGGGPGGGSGIPGGGGPGGDGEQEKPTLFIKPADVYSVQNPTPRDVVVQTKGTFRLSEYLKQGYRYDVNVVDGGNGVSSIRLFILYDADGNDITDSLTIEYLPGKLVATGKQIISMSIVSLSSVYDGKPHYLSDNYKLNNVPTGYTVELNLPQISITDVGFVSTEELYDYFGTGWYTVKNAFGADVTNDFFIVITPDVTDQKTAEKMLCGKTDVRVLEVSAVEVTFQSMSGTYNYTGKPYTYEVTLTYGALVEGHNAVITDTISITDVGTIKCVFDVTIYDADGNDVTSNYMIKFKYGELTVQE